MKKKKSVLKMKNHFSNGFSFIFKKGEIGLKTFCETEKKTRKSFTKSAKKLPIYQCGCKNAF